ncbi:hypothetical protein IC744_16235 [Microbacterium hominis]|uniref:hypothetical protein n=1 Tax=Microbacterium TaxID=33882 RepID=UPI00168A9855|nr:MULTISPECIES: hypothetical protein [Microbacterium]QOC24809.1 hypothetical protein IC745_10480 [Microbacterium hominis]QOC28863.1 hypothetical protein IC744_16235 [Microbacterium hominis]QYF98935.1 hypothetical protein KY498_06895 [Microbacterium sp. PAMC21962]
MGGAVMFDVLQVVLFIVVVLVQAAAVVLLARMLRRVDDIDERVAFLEPMFDVRRCRVCQCTDDVACMSGCWWVEEDLCSSCADDEAAS